MAEPHGTMIEVKIEPPSGSGLKRKLMEQIKVCYLDKGIPKEVSSGNLGSNVNLGTGREDIKTL